MTEGMTTDQAELLAQEPLPTERAARLEHLRSIAEHTTAQLTHCPECGEPIDPDTAVGHAVLHWGPHVPGRLMSPEARLREAALYRQAGQQPPPRV